MDAAPTATLTGHIWFNYRSIYNDFNSHPDTTYSNFTAASASTAGLSGLVVAPPAGAQGKFLRGDATWEVSDNDDTYSNASAGGADGTTAAN